MSELVVLALKIGFVAAMWLLILLVAAVIRTDLFGRRLSQAELAAAGGAPTATAPPKLSRKQRRNLPTAMKVTHGPQAGTVIGLDQPILIGRGPDCRLVLDDDYVSTHHAVIESAGDGFVLTDKGSTNGSFVNNERITAPTRLNRGDVVRIGRTQMSVMP